jgi:VanZ family protein
LVLAVSIGLWFFPQSRKNRRWALLWTALISAVYGVIDEIHQYFVPGRDCNVWDWTADTIGAILGALAMMAVYRYVYPLAGRLVSRFAKPTDTHNQ